MYSVKIYMIKLFSPLYYGVDLSNAMVYAIIYSGVIAMDLYKDMSQCILDYFKENAPHEQYGLVLEKGMHENPLAKTEEQQSRHKAAELLHVFLNYDNRCIKPILRKVYYSKALEKGLANEYTNYKPVVDEIAKKLRSGQSVLDRLSKKMKDILYEDGMLNDWRLYHFHLGESVENDFCQRTGELLIGFIPIHKNDMYFLKIIPDHRGNAVFADKELIEIIQDNWPELLDTFRLKCASLEYDLSSQQQYKMRKAGVTTPVQIGDSVYVGPGLGITTAGTSLQVQLKSNRIINWLTSSISVCRDLMREYVPEQIPQCLNFHLELDVNKRIFVIIPNRNVTSPKIRQLKNFCPF